ncbi:MAG: major capsid protein [Burkholderiales bacterium]|nr:major capsid protein [Burkholderiales bacterium]
MSTLLTWRSLTAAVNEIKSPNQFLRRLVFSHHETKPTETIEIGVYEKGRVIAPFVRKNGQAIAVGGHNEKFIEVGTPNIRIKRPFTPSELLFNRRPGNVIFASASDIQRAAQEHISRDLQIMADMVVNAEEWLSAMMIRGVTSYEVADQDNFTITVDKPSANTVTLTGDDLWDNADPSLPQPDEDFHLAKKLINDAVGLGVQDCVMGEEAATYFRRLMKSNHWANHAQKIDTGRTTFVEQFSSDGVIFIGTFCGIRCWEYSRTASLNGASVEMIRSKYVEFICTDPAAEHTLYYGAIPDMKAMEGNKFQGERFAKSWMEEDPSLLVALLASRPMPYMRRPGSVVSMKVVSG